MLELRLPKESDPIMNQGQELENLASSHTYNAGTYSDISGRRYRGKDEHALARLGKKQVLKVRC